MVGTESGTQIQKFYIESSRQKQALFCLRVLPEAIARHGKTPIVYRCLHFRGDADKKGAKTTGPLNQ